MKRVMRECKVSRLNRRVALAMQIENCSGDWLLVVVMVERREKRVDCDGCFITPPS